MIEAVNEDETLGLVLEKLTKDTKLSFFGFCVIVNEHGGLVGILTLKDAVKIILEAPKSINESVKLHCNTDCIVGIEERQEIINIQQILTSLRKRGRIHGYTVEIINFYIVIVNYLRSNFQFIIECCTR